MSKNEDLLTTMFTDEDVDDFKLDSLGDTNKDDNSSEDSDTSGEDNSDDKSDEKKTDIKSDKDKKSKSDDSDKNDTEDDQNDNESSSDKKDDKKKDDKKKTDDKSDDKKDSDDKSKNKDDKSDTGFDLFEDFKSDVSLDEKTSFDYESTIDQLGIEMEGEKPKTQKEFVDLIKNTIEKSKQTLKLEDYPPEVKLILDNLKKNNNLSVTDWYRNDTVRNADIILSMSDEQKVKMQLKQELKNQFSGDELTDAINDKIADMTDDEISKKAKDVNRSVMKVRNDEYNKIIKEKGEWLAEQDKKEKQKVTQERQVLVSKVQSMKEFMGFPIPENVTKILVKEIETGEFEKILDKNVADSKIVAYLFAKLGSKINDGIKKKIEIEKSSAYKDGTDTIIKQKHNIVTKSAGQQLNKRTSKDLTFEDDLFKE